MEKYLVLVHKMLILPVINLDLQFVIIIFCQNYAKNNFFEVLAIIFNLC